MLAFDRIDTKLFKAFLAAANESNFTVAAERAGMTQSGVSQHIGRLEEQLGIKLFERVNKKVLLTPEGGKLKAFIETYSDTLDEFVDRVSKMKTEPQGPVRYAMPASCLKTPHFPILLKKRARFSKIDLSVRISANDEIIELLLAGNIDFGFVTRRSENPAVQHESFAQEEYTLVGSDEKLLRSLTSDGLNKLPMISYPGMDVLLEYWRQTYFPHKRNFNVHSMNKRGEIHHLDGSITMVCHGVGCGVFPRHCVEGEITKKQLFPFRASGKTDPVGDIFIITRKHQTPPTRVRKVMDAFWEMKKEP